MPKRSALLGRPIRRFTSRRLTLLLVFLSLLAITLIGSLTSAIPSSPSLSAYDRKISVERIGDSISKSIFNPFRQPSHPPPRQKNDQYAGTSWWADWRWLSVPFSSSITLDDERALLPPLRERQPIYCYYDTTIKKTGEEKDAESDLLLTWRRAWWAQGFRPIILSAAEAMNNPSYEQVQTIEMDPELKEDLMRWLAWDTMGGGILSNYTLLPTVPREDSLLSVLRRGDYPNLTGWEGLDNAFFVGQKDAVSSAIRAILDSTKPKEEKSVAAALPDGTIEIDKASTPLGYYGTKVIETKYAKIIHQDKAKTLRDLNKLINYHLLIVWQNSFPDGIEVLKPHPEHATAMVSGALKLAKNLAICPESPMPASCPPNLPKCYPCVAAPMTIFTPPRYRDSSHVFTIGVVPHPWTFALVDNVRESINITWILESPRDTWLRIVTQGYLGTGVSSNRRVVRFKEVVAGEFATAHSLWLTAEDEMPNSMDWYFGFTIPKKAMEDGKSMSPVPADRQPKNEKPDRTNGPVASAEEVAHEQFLIDIAKKVVALTESPEETKLRTSLEAWNMADTEAWKFTRALQARRVMEREQWEKEEAKYSRGSGSEKGRSAWNRWQDLEDDKHT